MHVHEAIEKRRAYRALERVVINDDFIYQLTDAAKLAPSCFNKQPWYYAFVRNEDFLAKVKEAMMKGNEWTHNASMIIAVYTKKSDDCSLRGRDYYLFDTGMATAFLILRATELGMVAHPIAGYEEEEVKAALNIDSEFTIITLVNIGLHSETIMENHHLSEKQMADEKKRPERKAHKDFVKIY